ncbi:hypothetical protein [Stenotrophomonas sp. MMGLT7]|uniref:hypothetical protein n=1 Tax=Stenotrophomonas sp. MMGLT7 TaxID=2901227 RepID=UPI001E5C2778|nr:hypothetical protein [Stenotrophomonas sp. MMGLT7]MCD7099405.1 hypothetical protein [Stenotrophomonas sp. MMGLT7]
MKVNAMIPVLLVGISVVFGFADRSDALSSSLTAAKDLDTASLKRTAAEDAGSSFERRFTWNEIFSCTDKVRGTIDVSVSGVASGGNAPGTVPHGTADRLRVEVLRTQPKASPQRWFSSIGHPSFDTDEQARHASVLLANGMRLEFDRYGQLPDADADKADFDERPFFTLSIDGYKYRCGMQYNSK